MNHLKPEELLGYLDGVASPEAARRLGEHLESCPECAAELAAWRRSVEKLKRLPLPAGQRLAPQRRLDWLWTGPFLKWGLAAAVVLLLGFAAGRLSTPSVGALKKAVVIQVGEELRREMRADLLAAFGTEQVTGQDFQKQLRLDVNRALARAAANASENSRLLEDVMRTVQKQRDEDQRSLMAYIARVRDQQAADYLALRQDLETAVTTADSDLRQNSRRISQLANTLLAVQH